jgi:hypothetical protein
MKKATPQLIAVAILLVALAATCAAAPMANGAVLANSITVTSQTMNAVDVALTIGNPAVSAGTQNTNEEAIVSKAANTGTTMTGTVNSTVNAGATIPNAGTNSNNDATATENAANVVGDTQIGANNGANTRPATAMSNR